MEHRYPGFGPAPLWRLPVVAGGLFMLLGGQAWFLERNRDGIIIVIGAAVPLLLGLARLRRFRADMRYLRDQPPSSHERTAIILGALGASPADVAANARATITPAQWRRIEAETGTLGLINGPLPAVQVVEGLAALVTHQIRTSIWYDLTIKGIRFRSTTDTIVNGMQPNACYRLYFIDLPTPDRLRGTSRIILSAEGV